MRKIDDKLFHVPQWSMEYIVLVFYERLTEFLLITGGTSDKMGGNLCSCSLHAVHHQLLT